MTKGLGYAPTGKSKTIPTPNENRLTLARMKPKTNGRSQ